jgi:hypothetical protein
MLCMSPLYMVRFTRLTRLQGVLGDMKASTTHLIDTARDADKACPV